MKNKAFITTIIILAFVMSVSGCSSHTPVAVTSDTTAATTSIATETNEPTETAAVTTVIDSTMITEPSASGTTAPENTPSASVSETTAATSAATTSAPKETAAPTVAVTTKATAATSPKPTTAKPTTAATTKATGTTAETTEQPAGWEGAIPMTPTPVPVGTYSADMAQQVFVLVNQARADAGYPALTWDDTLAAACDIRAKEIVLHFGHTRPDGTGYPTASDGRADGENCAEARYYNTAQAVMDAWMASEGHKANILATKYTTIGISCYCVNGAYYWVQEFDAP